MKKTLLIVLAFAAIMAALYGLNTLLRKNDSSALEESTEQAEEVTVTWSNDLDLAHATKIALNGDSVSVAGSGAMLSGTVVTIRFPGTYALSGTLTSGQVIVDCSLEGTVYLVLSGADITSSDGPAIYVKQADLTVLELTADTKNRLCDSSSYTEVEGVKNQPDAALYSDDTLTIQGEGELVVLGYHNNAIRCRDDLNLEGGILNVSAVNDGIKANDYIVINGGTYSILAGGDGVQTTSELPDKGYILINGGSLDIRSTGDGFAVAGDMTVASGEISIVAALGSAHYADIGNAGVSAKGIKAASITIQGGTLNFDTADDALHATGLLTIASGTLNLASGDDAMQSDSELLITDGTVNVSASYQGLAAPVIRIAGGTVTVTAEDDGVNAGTGDVLAGQVGSACSVTISGGTVSISANRAVNTVGGFFTTGGAVTLESAVPLKCGADSAVTGGSLLAAGTLGNTAIFGEGSKQASLLYVFSAEKEAGTVFTLTDAGGSVLIDFTPESAYSTILVSGSALSVGQNYTLAAGEQSAEVTLEDMNTVSVDPTVVSTVGATAETDNTDPMQNKDFGMPGMAQ